MSTICLHKNHAAQTQNCEENYVKEDDPKTPVVPKEKGEMQLTSPALWLRCLVKCCRWTNALVGLLLCKGSRGSMNVVVRELWSTKKA